MSSSKNNPSFIERFLPPDIPERDKEFFGFMSEYNYMLMPVAFGVSYYRNRSLKWAAIHTMLAAPYVAFVLASAVARHEKERIEEEDDLL